MRTFAIGDIHGGFRALKQLIERLELTPNDKLIFLGDYVDGWSEAAQTIDYLIELENKYSCVFIKGNHDLWSEQWLRDGTKFISWFMHGGKETVDSYYNYSEPQKFFHLQFFEKMKNYYVHENRLFIHAGFSSMHGPDKEHYESNYSWDRTLWELALAMDSKLKKDSSAYPKRLKLYKEIYIGHTPTLNYGEDKPMNRVNVWNVDTGAAFNGPLSALNIETKEIIQSDIVKTMYPNERGRN